MPLTSSRSRKFAVMRVWIAALTRWLVYRILKGWVAPFNTWVTSSHDCFLPHLSGPRPRRQLASLPTRPYKSLGDFQPVEILDDGSCGITGEHQDVSGGVTAAPATRRTNGRFIRTAAGGWGKATFDRLECSCMRCCSGGCLLSSAAPCCCLSWICWNTIVV